MIDSSLSREPSLVPPGDCGVTPLFRAPGWSWISFGEIGWWVRPEWGPALLGPDGLKLDEWRRQGRLKTIKTGPHRIVYRADLPEGAVFVKHFKVPTWREMLRQWIRRGKGRNEGRRALRLASTGVPTITPLALGEQRKRKFLFENYLVTREISGTEPLDVFLETILPSLPEGQRARLRRSLTNRLAELTARLHNSGFLHQDFHPGNVLVKHAREHETPTEVSLAMIDLDALRWRKRLNWSDAEANLALLNHYFWLRCGRADRHRFLVAYLRERASIHPNPRTFAREIETSTRAWAERLWTRWGRRCSRNNKYFRVYRDSGCWGVASRDVDEPMMKTLMAAPDAPFSKPGATILKDSRTTRVAEMVLPVDGVPTKVIYKRFNRKKWLDPLLALFRPTRGWRAWQAGQHLKSRGLPTPTNLAYLQRQAVRRRWMPSWLLPLDSYVLTLRAEPSMTVADHVSRCVSAFSGSRKRAMQKELARSLARLVRTMHERSLSHRDLKAANILVEGDPLAESLALTLIDLVGVELGHPLSRNRRVQNLARLQVSLSRLDGWSRPMALRFLRDYLPWASTRRDEWKALWRDVERRGRRKERHNARSGRILS